MTDRELLEAAAKAAGLLVQGDWTSLGLFTGLSIRYDDCPGGVRWNPLTDDGDALRLAVKLRLSIYHPPSGEAMAFSADGKEAFLDVATRRAIVRAAAALEANRD